MTGRKRRLDELGALQQAVMEVIWRDGEATVQAVREVLARRGGGGAGEAEGRRPAYTTVLSVLQKLEKLGWVDHRSEGRSYVYFAKRTREEEGSHSLWSFIDGVFRGDPKVLFQHLIDGDRLSDADFTALREMIDARREERGDD